MPIYEYRCEDCSHEFAVTMSMSEHDKAKVACPECNSVQVTQKFSLFSAKTSKKS